MTEKERKLVVERINANLEKLKILKEYKKRLEELEKLPEVIKYLEKTGIEEFEKNQPKIKIIKK